MDDLPRLYARTQRFALGRPRDVAIADDGTRLLFLRSRGGEDLVHHLWELDLASGEERLVADAGELSSPAGEELPPEERARRERQREAGSGIVSFAGTPDLGTVAFALSGRLFVASVTDARWSVRELPTLGPAFDPRPEPSGRLIAYAFAGGLHVVDVDGRPATLADDPDPDVRWGVAEFAAAEEMDRQRGYWWSPDGTALLATRVDERDVATWYIASPVDPDATPTPVRYPAAGTRNADVSLHLLDIGPDLSVRRRTEVAWDREAWPYLVRVQWSASIGPVILVHTRDQRRLRLLRVDIADGSTSVVHQQAEDPWLEAHGDLPRLLDDGRVASRVRSDDTFRLAIDGQLVTPPGLQVRALAHVTDDHLLVVASHDPTESHLHRLDLRDLQLEALTTDDGWHQAVGGGDVYAVTSASMDATHPMTTVIRGGATLARLRNVAAEPPVTPRVRFLEPPRPEIRSALLLPADDPGGPLPVLLDPYGGPHGPRVVKSHSSHLVSQWFADQGFAVLVVDGRGMPGAPSREDAVHLDFAGPVLEDQVDALHAAAEQEPRLDLSRVAIRGWSFGGYLAALAVLRRPDVFHGAIAGAPVTDMLLYDTYYTERYLGHPAEYAEAYRRSSLLDDAAALERPLLLIHGLADDNVVVAHSLRLSRALLEAGRPHTFVPLSGVTHMARQEKVAENLLRLQLTFLRDALGVPPRWRG